MNNNVARWVAAIILLSTAIVTLAGCGG